MLVAWGWRNFKWVSEGVQKCEKVCSETRDPKSQTNKATVIVVAKWFRMKSVISSKESYFFLPETLWSSVWVKRFPKTTQSRSWRERWDGETTEGLEVGRGEEWEDRSLSVLYFFLTVLKIGLLLSESQISKRVSWNIISHSYAVLSHNSWFEWG